jgi:hypothetical protein
VRYVFAVFAAALLLMAGVQSFAKPQPRMGLSNCGWDEKPCVLEELVVKAKSEPQVIPTAEPVAVRPVQHVRTARPSTPEAQS